ncbi:MAG: hypothetical protein MUO77_04940 [Anaerolineales bacterium]|nr:hypothetical protein [Anaerolineales bacterium]
MDKKLPVIILIVVAFSPPIVWDLFGFGSESSLGAAETIRPMSLFNQVVVVFTAFILKPLHMLISIILAWLLRKTRNPDVIAMRWGLLALFIGEAFCAMNYLVFRDQSCFVEYLHSFGMVVSFGFIAYALLEGLDRRIIQYSNPQKQCAFISLCASCIKTQAVPCRVRKLFLLASLALSLLVFIPLITKINEISYNTYIFGTLYNYNWLKVNQLFEIRYSPLLALVMFLSTFIILQRSKEQLTPNLVHIFLSAGIGALGLGFFRLILGSIYAYNLSWADSWEEITEFLLMIIITYILWLFRQRLGISIGYLCIHDRTAPHKG